MKMREHPGFSHLNDFSICRCDCRCLFRSPYVLHKCTGSGLLSFKHRVQRYLYGNSDLSLFFVREQNSSTYSHSESELPVISTLFLVALSFFFLVVRLRVVASRLGREEEVSEREELDRMRLPVALHNAKGVTSFRHLGFLVRGPGLFFSLRFFLGFETEAICIRTGVEGISSERSSLHLTVLEGDFHIDFCNATDDTK